MSKAGKNRGRENEDDFRIEGSLVRQVRTDAEDAVPIEIKKAGPVVAISRSVGVMSSTLAPRPNRNVRHRKLK